MGSGSSKSLSDIRKRKISERTEKIKTNIEVLKKILED